MLQRRFVNGPTQSLDKIDSGWLKKKVNAALRYMVLPATMGLDLFYAHKGRGVECYLLFIGYSKAGSSMLGRLLDAHPEMVVSHERHILKHFLGRGVYKRGHVIRKILDRKQLFPLKVKDQWQGRYSHLRVIGDKSSLTSTRHLYSQPSRLDLLRSTMGLPLRVLCTCRNPYDIVAAQHLTDLRDVKLIRNVRHFRDYEPADSEKYGLAPLSPERRSAFDWLFEVADKLTKVLSMFSEAEVLLVRHEDLIASPKDKLRNICAFLDVQCTEDYLDSCAAVVYPSPHKTRLKVQWTAEEIEQVAAAIEKYPWFEGYTFDG